MLTQYVYDLLGFTLINPQVLACGFVSLIIVVCDLTLFCCALAAYLICCFSLISQSCHHYSLAVYCY